MLAGRGVSKLAAATNFFTLFFASTVMSIASCISCTTSRGKTEELTLSLAKLYQNHYMVLQVCFNKALQNT